MKKLIGINLSTQYHHCTPQDTCRKSRDHSVGTSTNSVQNISRKIGNEGGARTKPIAISLSLKHVSGCARNFHGNERWLARTHQVSASARAARGQLHELHQSLHQRRGQTKDAASRRVPHNQLEQPPVQVGRPDAAVRYIKLTIPTRLAPEFRGSVAPPRGKELENAAGRVTRGPFYSSQRSRANRGERSKARGEKENGFRQRRLIRKIFRGCGAKRRVISPK